MTIVYLIRCISSLLSAPHVAGHTRYACDSTVLLVCMIVDVATSFMLLLLLC